MIVKQPRPPINSLNRFLRWLQHAGFLVPATLTGYLWLKGGHPTLPGWSCPLRALTGIPCPTCFLTRSTELALRGDLSSAWDLHPLGPLVAAGLVIWSLRALQQRRLLPQRPLPWPPLAAAGILTLIIWVARLPAWVSAR